MCTSGKYKFKFCTFTRTLWYFLHLKRIAPVVRTVPIDANYLSILVQGIKCDFTSTAPKRVYISLFKSKNF